MKIEIVTADREERQIVGACLAHAGVVDEVLTRIQPEEFNDQASQEIMVILKDMRRRNLYPSIVTFGAEIKPETEHLFSHASELFSESPIGMEIPILLNKIVSCALARKLQTTFYDALIDVQKNHHEIEAVISRCETAVFKACETRHDVEIRSMADVMQGTRKKVLAAMELRHQGIKPDIISLGLDDLDKYTNGLKPGQMVVIAARPGVGKSILGLQSIVANAAKGKPVGIVTLEMAPEELTCRALATDSNISLSRIIEADFDDSGKHEELQWPKVEKSMDYLEGLPIWFVDAPSMRSGELRAKARKLRSKHKIELLVIDYLQLLSADEKNKQRTLEVGEIARTAKSIARELKIPVIALAQLNRVEGEPSMHHLRESGEIEQAADIIILLHRYEETEDGVLKSLHPTKMNICKQRNGKTGPLETVLEGRFCRFISIPRTAL